MPVRFYMDVHVPHPITEQLRRRGVEVLTAYEDGAEEWQDDQVLLRATEQGWVVFTQDVRFRVMAEEWQRQERHFGGLIFGHQLHASIGQYVQDLELIAKVTEPHEWIMKVGWLPLR
jgi:hypothetical protein